MKVRTGFVSNSSTSSFCLYGAYLENFQRNEEDDENFDVYDHVEKYGLECHRMDYCDGVYTGISWANIGDDETGAQFKERVKNIILKLLSDNDIDASGVQFETLEEAYYN